MRAGSWVLILMATVGAGPAAAQSVAALYRLALRLGGGDEPWAEEPVQRSWIRAVEGLGAFGWRSRGSAARSRRHR
jgi:DNA-directed RNA polymerase specialized sigma24 family protein